MPKPHGGPHARDGLSARDRSLVTALGHYGHERADQTIEVALGLRSSYADVPIGRTGPTSMLCRHEPRALVEAGFSSWCVAERRHSYPRLSRKASTRSPLNGGLVGGRNVVVVMLPCDRSIDEPLVFPGRRVQYSVRQQAGWLGGEM
jgi:hypothetical protein